MSAGGVHLRVHRDAGPHESDISPSMNAKRSSSSPETICSPPSTPVLEFIRSEGWDPMGAYFASLEKVASLEVDLVLPGHRSEFKNCRGRAGEIRAYHETRLARNDKHSRPRQHERLRSSPADGERPDRRDTRSRDYSLFEKTIATGEAVAHLDHLAKIGTVQKEITEKGPNLFPYKFLFSIKALSFVACAITRAHVALLLCVSSAQTTSQTMSCPFDRWSSQQGLWRCAKRLVSGIRMSRMIFVSTAVIMAPHIFHQFVASLPLEVFQATHPLVKRGLRHRLPYYYSPIFFLKAHILPRINPQPFPHLLRNSNLPLRRHLSRNHLSPH